MLKVFREYKEPKVFKGYRENKEYKGYKVYKEIKVDYYMDLKQTLLQQTQAQVILD